MKLYIDHNSAAGFTSTQYKALLLDLLDFPLNKIKTNNTASDVTNANAFVAKVMLDRDKQKQIVQIYSQVVKDFINSSAIIDNATAKTTLNDLKNRITDFYNTSESLVSAVNKVKEFRKNKIGWMLEVAGALNLATLKNNQQLSGSKSGFWFTLTHSPEKVHGFEFIGLLRYLNERNEVLNADNFDGGVKAVFDQGQFFVSIESVNRTQTTFTNVVTSSNGTAGNFNSVNGWRWGVNIGYRISPAIVIASSFGKSFNSDVINKGGYLSLLDVNFGFGKPTTTIK